MAEPIRLGELRDNAQRGHGEIVTFDQLLALIEAVEAANTLLGGPAINYDNHTRLAQALTRFDFGDTP